MRVCMGKNITARVPEMVAVGAVGKASAGGEGRLVVYFMSNSQKPLIRQ